jgi:hypothetical protein
MQYLHLPFFDVIADSRTVLVAGCGGGYDVFTGLPLYFGLRAAGKTVYLANLSFSPLAHSAAAKIASGLYRVDADMQSRNPYFPELHLSHWFAARGENVPIYCFDQVGVVSLTDAYKALIAEVKPDAIVLVDGGTDSLMRGDEAGLGTPHEDISSIVAVSLLDVPIKLLTRIGFGVDTYHGVCHAQFLEAVAEITRDGGFLGAWSITQEMPEVQLYREATDFVFRQVPDEPSVVSASILSAVEGRYGNYHATDKTKGSKLYINALMTLYWCFQLDAVARRILYYEDMLWTNTHGDVSQVILNYRATHKAKSWQNLPM